MKLTQVKSVFGFVYNLLHLVSFHRKKNTCPSFVSCYAKTDRIMSRMGSAVCGVEDPVNATRKDVLTYGEERGKLARLQIVRSATLQDCSSLRDELTKMKSSCRNRDNHGESCGLMEAGFDLLIADLNTQCERKKNVLDRAKRTKQRLSC